MLKTLIRLLFAVSLLVTLPVFVQAQENAPFLQEFTVAGPTAGLKTDGNFMLYRSRREDSSLRSDLYAIALSNGAITQLATNVTFETPYAINGGIAVWAEARDNQVAIRALDLRSHSSFELGTSPALAGEPHIQNGVVVWGEQRSDGVSVRAVVLADGRQIELARGSRLLAGPLLWGDHAAWAIEDGSSRQMVRRNIRTLDPPQIWANLQYTEAHIFAFSDTHIAWTDYVPITSGRDLGPHPSVSYVLDFRDGQTRTFDVVVGGSDLKTFADVAPGANTVILSRGEETTPIASINLLTGERRTLKVPADTRPLLNDDRYLIFEQRPNFKLYGYELPSDSAFPIGVEDGVNILPALSNGVIAYQIGAGDMITLRAAQIARLLPASQQTFYGQTGHTLSGVFRTFWQQSGGLATFGYPLTEEIKERNSDTGWTYTVQYFERQRFEYHPENAGTPYVVQIGRLGASDAAERGVDQSPAFSPIAQPNDPNCKWFSETSHSVCGTFLRYWRRDGVELGDPGVSERESLALYGLPISEPYVDSQLGRTVQYFERARFEDFPENAEPYKVQFGRLGADEAP